MKKILILLLAAASMATFTGCTGPNITETRTTAVDSSTIKTRDGRLYTVGGGLITGETYVTSFYTFGTADKSDDIIIENIELEIYELNKMDK